MDVDFTLRDMLYISVYLITITVFVIRSDNRIKGVEKLMNTTNKILFRERGGLNVIVQEDCEKYQASLLKHSQDALNQIGVLNQNVVAIMIDMNLKPIPMKPETLTK